MITKEEWNAKKKKRKYFYHIHVNGVGAVFVKAERVEDFSYRMPRNKWLTAAIVNRSGYRCSLDRCFFSRQEADEYARTINED